MPLPKQPPTPRTRALLAEAGQALVQAMCQANDLAVPPMPGKPHHYMNKWQACGLYLGGKIYVNPAKCASLGMGGPAWSWPGYIIDRTPYGVHAHELGHHLDHVLTVKLGTYFARLVRDESREDRLTTYCPNTGEWLAEMLRLYTTNPDLLRLVRPRTYAVLADYLLPCGKRTWQQVLHDAPDRTRAMATRRIAEALG